MNEFLFYQFLSTSVTYFFNITHIHSQCRLFSQFYNLFATSSLSLPFENFRIDERTTRIFSPKQKCINFLTFLARLSNG